MKELMAKDCLSKDVIYVHEEERPSFNANYFAVFKDRKKKKFLGLVRRSRITHPYRIFADLIQTSLISIVSPDIPAGICEEKMRALNTDALAVIDDNKNFYGIVTYKSVSSALLGKRTASKAKTIKLFEALRKVLHGVESYHDSYTLIHEENTGKMMKCLGHTLGLDKKFCDDLEQAGSLHDIGKLALPSSILDKPGKLNSYERGVIEMHPVIGSNMLKKIDHPLAEFAASINLNHHECYDGSGYPHQLKKDQIPLEARICSLCDIYDAMRAHRPYHKGKTHQIVKEAILSKKKGGFFHKFDPTILEAFAEIHIEFDAIFSVNLAGIGNAPKSQLCHSS